MCLRLFPHPSPLLPSPRACPPVRKAFKCLGVVAAYAVSVCLTVSLPRRRLAFDDIYICESQLIAVEKSSLVFGLSSGL